MSKITNDGLTRSGTGCFITYSNSGRQRVNSIYWILSNNNNAGQLKVMGSYVHCRSDNISELL